jgi:ATP-dependent exoDNAse (exonuclease V) alpha subunit
MNGDIGVIIEVDKTRRIILVEFAGKAEEYSISTSQWGGDYSYHGEGDMMTTDSLSLAHAITTHKSQGAQWALNIFVFPVDNTSYSQAEEFYNFHMIYTALSRTIIRVRVIGNIREFHRSFDRKPEEKIDHLGQKLAARLAQDRIDHLDQELAV